MKKICYFLSVLLISIFIISCSKNNETKNNQKEKEEQEQVVIDEKKVKKILYTFNNGEEDLLDEVKDIETYEFIIPERDGYSFMEWYYDVELLDKLNKENIASKVNSDGIVHIYADWHIDSYKVQFYCSNKLVKTQSVEYLNDAVSPTPLFKPGFRFIGWDKEYTKVKEDLIVNAVYEEIELGDNILVVLGYYLNDDGTMHATLKKRLDLAIKAYNEFNPSYIIVSGGLANTNAGKTEAQAMYDYLVSKGIDQGVIIKEEKSLSTQQNAVNSIKLLETVDFKNLIIVSTIEHFTQYQTIKFFNDAINSNTKVAAKNINLMIYTNTN